MRKWSSCGVFFFFLRCQFHGLSLTSPIRDGTRFHTNFCRKGHIQISQTRYAWRRHQLSAVVGSMLTGAAHKGYDCKHLGYQNLKIRVNSRISCLALAEEIWQISHEFKPNTQSAVQPSKCIFPCRCGTVYVERLSSSVRSIVIIKKKFPKYKLLAKIWKRYLLKRLFLECGDYNKVFQYNAVLPSCAELWG